MDTNTKERIRIKLNSLRNMISKHMDFDSDNIDNKLVSDFSFISGLINALDNDSLSRENLEACNRLYDEYYSEPGPKLDDSYLWDIPPEGLDEGLDAIYTAAGITSTWWK